MPKINFDELRRMLPKRRNKYNVAAKERRTCDGITFDSRKEMLRYQELKAAAARHECWFIRQPMFDTGGGTKYRADFLIFWFRASGVAVEDVKGHRTAAYKRAKKQVEALYPMIKIEEV